MSNQESNYGKGLLTGVVIGAAVGAIAALLFAPKTGKELREELIDKGSDIYDKAQDFSRDTNLGEEVPPVNVNEGRVRAERIVQNAREHAESLLTNAEHVLREARSKATSVKDSVQENIDKVRSATRLGVEAFQSEINGNENEHHQG